MGDLLGLAGGGEGSPEAVDAEALEEVADPGKGLDAGHVVAGEELGAGLLHLFLAFGEELRRDEAGEELVAALADVAADLVVGGGKAEPLEDVEPSLGVEVDGVHERAVHVEDDGLGSGHDGSPGLVGSPTAGRAGCSRQ
nr:hypothetical protein [Rubellimicrobium mesophilum]